MPPSEEMPAARAAILRNECPHCGVRMKLSRKTLPNGERMRKCPKCKLLAHGTEDGHSIHYPRETQKERYERLDAAREGLMTENDWDEIRRILGLHGTTSSGPK